MLTYITSYIRGHQLSSWRSTFSVSTFPLPNTPANQGPWNKFIIKNRCCWLGLELDSSGRKIFRTMVGDHFFIVSAPFMWTYRMCGTWRALEHGSSGTTPSQKSGLFGDPWGQFMNLPWRTKFVNKMCLCEEPFKNIKNFTFFSQIKADLLHYVKLHKKELSKDFCWSHLQRGILFLRFFNEAKTVLPWQHAKDPSCRPLLSECTHITAIIVIAGLFSFSSSKQFYTADI